MFRCETDQYGGIVFGAYDGIRNWQVNSFATIEVVQQELISAHEERHLRLQQGTPYGAALAILGAAVRDGNQSMEGWATSIDRCREVHETYATYMSVAHVPNSLNVLSGNLAYLEYWSVGDALHDRVNATGAGLQILEILFHQLMSPRPAALAAVAAPAHLVPALRLVRGQSPNDRLRHVVRIARSEPRFVSDLIDAVSLGRSIEAQLDEVASLLEQAGLPTLATDEQDALSREIQDVFNSGEHGHHATLTARSRATSLEDQLDYIAAERIHLHPERLPLLVGTESWPEGVHPLTPFARDNPGVGPHIWTVLLTGDALRRQFDSAIEDGIYLGFLSCDRDGASGLVDTPTAFFMPIMGTPELATRELAEVGLRTLTMTTLSSISGVVRSMPFSASEPLFVIVDEAVRPFLMALRDEGRILWATVALGGDRLLHAVVLTVDDGRPLHFLWVGTIYPLKPILEWLRRESAAFVYVGDDYPDVKDELFAVLKHLVGTFSVLAAR